MPKLLRNTLRILDHTLIDPDPIHLFRDPDLFRRGKGVAVVEGRERDACGGAVPTPGKQGGAAGLAEHPVKRLRRAISAGFTLNFDRLLVKQRPGKERRSRCPLTFAAMADADIDWLAMDAKPHRATKTSAVSDHESALPVGSGGTIPKAGNPSRIRP